MLRPELRLHRPAPHGPRGLVRFSIACLLVFVLAVPAQASDSDVRGILDRFAADYEIDPYLTRAVVFGVRVDGEWWTIRASPSLRGSPAEVLVDEGRPEEPTFFFFLDRETLGKLDRGELNARTALGKARMSDSAPMDIDPTDPELEWTQAFDRTVDSVANHFWLRGRPELIAFNKEASRVLHGANAVLLHYSEGLRSVWYQLEPGQHINAEPKDQVNPFPSLFIFVSGSAKARIGGIETEIVGGTATLVPAGVAHELWNPGEEPLEFVLIMFGEGA